MNKEHQIAVVTGGTGGLGRVICNTLSLKGIKVYVPTRNVEKFRSIFDNSDTAYEKGETFLLRKIYSLYCDPQNESDVKEFTDEVVKMEGKIDYLVNTTGGYHPKINIADMEYQLVQDMMDLNLKTTFLFTKHVLNNMIKNNFGRIVSTAAKAATEVTPGKYAYAISKYAVIDLMKTLALENNDYDITANVLVPNIIDTSANRESMPKADFSKWTKPEEIANLVYFLLCDDGKINGNVISV